MVNARTSDSTLLVMENMRPAQAAQILEGLLRPLRSKFSLLMNQAKAGRALAAMNPAKAAMLAAKLGAPWEDRAC